MTVANAAAEGPDPSSRFRAVMIASFAVIALATGSAAALRALPALDSTRPFAPLVLFFAFALIERFPVHLETERGVYTWSAYEIPLTFALFYATPTTAFAMCVAGTFAVRLTRKQGPTKLAFNTAATAAHAIAATLAFRWTETLSGHDALASLLLALAILELLSVLNVELVAGVIRFTGGTVDRAAQQFARAGSAFATLWSVSLSLAGVVILRERATALVFLAVVMAVTYLGVRMITAATQRILALKMLHEFSVRLSETSLVESPATATLTHVRSVLRAERALLLLLNGATHRSVPDLDAAAEELHVSHPLVREAIESRRIIRLVRTEGRRRDLQHQRSEAVLRDLGVKDLMIAPLVRNGGVVGVMVVANRAADTSTFSKADEALFETMAGHAIVTVENGDLVERLRAEANLREHESLHDALTGLANRTFFNRLTDRAISQGTGVAVMLVDLNRFKEINDTLGHHVGDEMLHAVAEKLALALPSDAVIARLGGDEFAVLLRGISSVGEASEVAECLVRSVDEPIAAGGVVLALDIAIGVAVSGRHGNDRAELLKAADAAMYSAKEHRRAAWAIYEPEQERVTSRQFSLVVDLRKALRNKELTVHYQPRIALQTGLVEEFEALARWKHPTLGMIPPDEFVPLAERSGLIFELTAEVVRIAMRDCANWRRVGILAGVGINLSGRASLDQKFSGLVKSIVADSGLNPSLVVLEITEHELMNDEGLTRRMLESLRNDGFRVAIDDFGTGHSSLSYLTSLPVDELKIDKSFVLGMSRSATERVIVETVVSLGKSLGLPVVAEGVEDLEAAMALRALGCDYGQGYYFARPMPVNDIAEWHERYSQSLVGAH